jgi:hypothetical protein
MIKRQNPLMKKWWVKTIRERNYFGFRYWWFNWLMLASAILLFFWGISKLNKNETDACNANFDNKMDSIYNDLMNCCTCETDSVIPPPPPIEDTVPPKDTTTLECPDRTLVFQVCNSNSARDDNFDVYLNNVKIGNLNLNTDQKVGSVFIATTNRSLKITKADFICPISNMKVFYFDPSIVKFGKNKLFLKNTQNNTNGNLGTIEIRNYLIVGTELKDPCKVKDLKYQMPSGNDFKISFNYTKCCE